MIRLQSNLPLAECQQKLRQAVHENESEQLITGIVNEDGTFWLEHIPEQPTNFKQRYFSEKFEGEMAVADGFTEINGDFVGDVIYVSAIYLLALVLAIFAFGLLLTAVRSMNFALLIIPLAMIAFVVYWLHNSRGLSEPGQQAILHFIQNALDAHSLDLT